MEYKKKFTDMFLRKDDKPKKQFIPEKPKIEQFDEQFFESHLVCNNIHTTLMKLTATIRKEGPNSGEPIPVKCKWYTKNEFDFKEIEQVKGNCFQPCLQDVGNKICVQIQPYLQGMKYNGITIMKESQKLKLDPKLQTFCHQYFLSKHIEMEGKIQNIYSQNQIYSKYSLPLDITIQLRQNKVYLFTKENKTIISEFQINENFPQVDFIRKSFNSILFSCNPNQSMKLTLNNNFNRDLFALILRSISTRISSLLDQSVQEYEFSSPIRSKSAIQTSSQQTTKLILKLDELHKQIKNQKKINEQITNNYHLQRLSKINLEQQISKLKILFHKTNTEHQQCKYLHTKIKQVTEQNKFYFGQISLLKNQLKQKNFVIKELKTELISIKTQKCNIQAKMQQISTLPISKIKSLEKELIFTKNLLQSTQMQNQSLKETINQLQNQKNALKKKVNSIVSQKSLLSTPVKSNSKVNSLQVLISPAKDSQIKQLKMQITNLEMLLKHRSGQKGGDPIRMHLLINNLTEKISQKQLEIQALKKINKQISKNAVS